MGDRVALVVMLLAGLALVGLGVLLMFSQHALRRRLERMPRGRTRQVRPGELVKLVGRMTTRVPMLAPLANVDCLYYRLAVLEGSGSEGEQWTEVSSERMYADDWMLEDESGRIGVRPEDGTLESLRLREYNPNSLAPAEDVRRDVVMRYVPRQDRLFERPVRLREERLEQGTPVVLFGRVIEGPHGAMIAGGHELEVYAQTEQQLAAPKPLDFFSWALLLGGVGMIAWGVMEARPDDSEPVAGEAMPIERSASSTPPPLPVLKRVPPKAASPSMPAPPPPRNVPNRLRRH
jgi:hypothetical protein